MLVPVSLARQITAFIEFIGVFVSDRAITVALNPLKHIAPGVVNFRTLASNRAIAPEFDYLRSILFDIVLIETPGFYLAIRSQFNLLGQFPGSVVCAEPFVNESIVYVVSVFNLFALRIVLIS